MRRPSKLSRKPTFGSVAEKTSDWRRAYATVERSRMIVRPGNHEDFGFLPPREGIPDAALMVKRLPGYDEAMAGRAICPEAFDGV
jgi:hypothetical protein